MKIYHKFLLYQNKWIHPYVRMTVGVMTSITYLASILLIVGVVYEHGFTISEVEAHQLQRLYHGVWIVFLVDVTLRILLEYKDTRRTFSKLTWILTILLYLTLIPVIFHRPEEEGAILQFWEFLHGKAYHLVLLLVFSFFYNPQIQISAESETKRSIFREKDKTKRSKKESAQHSKSRNKSFVMTSVSAL